tara:strand:+ start:1071 stop:1199 length:129 start_codon:yes stop_codon:yes gene_type:complete
MLISTSDELNTLHDEVERYRQQNEKLVKRWKDKYVDDGSHEY